MSTASLRAQISALDRQISAQKQHLLDLETARDALDAQLRRVATFPIDTVPAEVISEIFAHCRGWSCISNSAESAPLLLMKVCRRWARIAARTPALWSSLGLGVDVGSFHARDQVDGQELVDVVLLWLRNCKGRLAVDFWADFPVHSHASDVLGLIAANAAKVSSFTYEAHPAAMLVLAEHAFSFENLKELALIIDLHTPQGGLVVSSSELGGLSFRFTNMLKLQKVTLVSVELASLALPWSQITDLTLRSYSGSGALDILRSLPNLVRFTAALSYEASAENRTNFAPVTHGNLRYFEIQETDAIYLDEQLHMLQYLTLPNLSTLITDQVPEYMLSDFLIRSRYPKLEALELSVPREADFDDAYPTLELFSHLGTVNRLGIRQPTPSFVGALCAALRTQSSFLPRLNFLEIDSLPIKDSVLDSVIAMLAERWRSSSAELRCVRIVLLSEPQLEQDNKWRSFALPSVYVETLEKWKSCGFELHVCSKWRPEDNLV